MVVGVGWVDGHRRGALVGEAQKIAVWLAALDTPYNAARNARIAVVTSAGFSTGDM